MDEAVFAAYRFLREQYPRYAGLELADGALADDPASQTAIWYWQDPDLRHALVQEQASGGVVLDSEVGVCAFVQRYTRELDVSGQLTRALRIRSELLPGRDPMAEDVDVQGEWRVALHWLVAEADLASWVSKIAALREETAHFEEVPVDAVVNNTGTWHDTCVEHGFPRLLFRTRSVLAKAKHDETLAWANAEPILVRKLRDVPRVVSGSPAEARARQLVRQLDQLALSATGRQATAAPDRPMELFRIAIKNFRNLEDVRLELRPEDEPVYANVVQGPNGSGKSSIFESMMLATGSVSNRYIEFLADPNEAAQGKSRKYIERYLSPLRFPGSSPYLGINNEQPIEVRLAEPESAKSDLERLSGTFLSPKSGDGLLSRRANELGALIAASYSGTARAVSDWVENQQREAEAKRAQFNRSWGIRQNVSRADTARERIVESVLSNVLTVPEVLQRWSQSSVSSALATSVRNLTREWQELVARQGIVFREISASLSEAQVERLVRTFIELRNTVLHNLEDETTRIANVKAGGFQDIVEDVERWGRWLSNPEQDLAPSDRHQVASLRPQADAASSELANIAAEGAALRARAEHLTGLQSFLDKHWLSGHPDECPTCGTNLSDRNGLAAVIKEVRAITQSRLVQLRSDYQEVRARLDSISAELSAAGASEPPISAERQAEVLTKLSAAMGRGIAADDIGNPNSRSQILDCLSWIDNVPAPPTSFTATEQVERHAAELSRRIWNAFVTLSAVADAPEAWKEVQKAVVEVLTEAVREHLPGTVQALWLELARNMMPAPWQYPGKVQFDVAQRRGQPEARIIVQGKLNPLAVHILNGAEVQNLAIAWFFTRYLLHGRYHWAFMVLDDPAYQMDQPMFRDFCRLLESFMRLHKFRSIPLTLIVLLHQDERALDAARATDGTLHRLRWNKGTPALQRQMRMRSAATLPRKPHRIMEHA